MTSDDGSPRVLGGRYELRHQLGAGGAGAVWAGHDRTLDRPVAIKLLHADLSEDPAAEARFRTEATASASLTHPSAVLVYDVGRDGAADYLVMELVEGSDLATVLSHGPLPHAAAAHIGAGVASALGSAHRSGIVHRDVKPGNVLLTDEGQAKLADFGIARALGDLESRLTRTGTVLGTARYLAPEQLRDDPLDGRADVYSLGVVLHEALTGHPPFGEGGVIEVATRRLTTPLPAVTDLVPDVPPELAEIVDWATQVDPRQRPADGDELADALRAFVTADAAAMLARRVTAVQHGTGIAADRAAPAAPATPRATPTPVAAPVGAGRTATLPATPTLHPEADPASAAGPPDRGSRRGILWAGLLAVAALVAAVTLGPGLLDGAAPGGGGTASEPLVLDLAEAGDHDPFGTDQEERPQDVPNAIDGDRETFWPTQTYTTAELGGLKPGVGVWVRLAEEPSDLDRIELTLTADAGELELWVGDGPPTRDQVPDDWGSLVGRGTIDDTRVRFPLEDREVSGDTLLLWFTELPPGGDGFRAEVRTIEVFGR